MKAIYTMIKFDSDIKIIKNIKYNLLFKKFLFNKL